MRGDAPLSRRAGRWTGRWWIRHGDDVRRASRPARRGWATAAAYGWFVAYGWVGLLLSVAATRLVDGPAPLASVVAIAGGVVLGAWQARWRLQRHEEPATPPLSRFGLALCAWLGLVGLAILAAL